MTIKELKKLIKDLPDDAEILFVSETPDNCGNVDDIAAMIAPANDSETAFYLYSEEFKEKHLLIK